MHNKIVFIITLVAVIGGFGAFSKILGNASDSKTVAYKPYRFTERDQAELVVTKFIRAIEIGDINTATLLIDKDADYSITSKIIGKFYSEHYQSKAKKHLIFYPRAFVFDDSVVAMHFDIRNTIKPYENKEAMLSLVNKENQWLIKTSSSFFEVLMLFSSNKKKTGDTR